MVTFYNFKAFYWNQECLLEFRAVFMVEKCHVVTRSLYVKYSQSTAEVQLKQNFAQEKQSDLERQSEVIGREKVEAEQALEDALPALEAAAEALNNLKKDEITEIRSFAKPHILVQKVLLELDIFLDAATFNWMNELKKFMV